MIEYWKDAVRNYEQAPMRDPSDEKYASNEIALGYTDPSCVQRDKAFEPNNSLDGAKHCLRRRRRREGVSQQPIPAESPMPEESTWNEELLSCPNDPDIYRIALEPGDRLSATLKAGEGEGDWRLFLWTKMAGSSQKRMELQGEHLEAPKNATLSDEENWRQDRLIRVSNMDEEEVAYELEIKRTPACSTLDTEFEPNNSYAQAAPIEFTAPESRKWVMQSLGKRSPKRFRIKTSFRRAMIMPYRQRYLCYHTDAGDRLSASLKALKDESKAHLVLTSRGAAVNFVLLRIVSKH